MADNPYGDAPANPYGDAPAETTPGMRGLPLPGAPKPPLPAGLQPGAFVEARPGEWGGGSGIARDPNPSPRQQFLQNLLVVGAGGMMGTPEGPQLPPMPRAAAALRGAKEAAVKPVTPSVKIKGVPLELNTKVPASAAAAATGFAFGGPKGAAIGAAVPPIAGAIRGWRGVPPPIEVTPPEPVRPNASMQQRFRQQRPSGEVQRPALGSPQVKTAGQRALPVEKTPAGKQQTAAGDEHPIYAKQYPEDATLRRSAIAKDKKFAEFLRSKGMTKALFDEANEAQMSALLKEASAGQQRFTSNFKARLAVIRAMLPD